MEILESNQSFITKILLGNKLNRVYNWALSALPKALIRHKLTERKNWWQFWYSFFVYLLSIALFFLIRNDIEIAVYYQAKWYFWCNDVMFYFSLFQFIVNIYKYQL